MLETGTINGIKMKAIKTYSGECWAGHRLVRW